MGVLIINQRLTLKFKFYNYQMQPQLPDQSQEPRRSFDDQPIGNTNKAPILDEYPPDFNPDDIMDDKKPEPLPLNKRIQSKVWKIRKEALQQLWKEVNENWQNYQQFENMSIKLVTDSNQACQDKALKILRVYLENGNQLNSQPKPLIKALIQKCLIINKGEIAHTATQVLYWMMDNYKNILLNELNQSILNKNPKIVQSTLGLLEKILNNYGAKKLQQLEMFAKHFTLLANSVRPIAKSHSVQFFKEGFRWMGQNIFNSNMHPEVKDQVVKFSKTYVKQPMVIKRGLNEEQKKSKKPITQSNDDDDDCDQPQDVLGPYDTRWVDKVLEIQKWKEKKQALDQFIKKTKAKNIVPRDSSHYITLVKRLLNENNINLLQCGFKIVRNLCRGLKKNFTHPSFGKLRDSKAMIVDEAHQTLQGMLSCLNFEDFIQDIREGMKEKAAHMRLQTLKFIEKCLIKKEKKISNSIKMLTQSIVDMNQDGSVEVRDKVIDILCKIKVIFGMNFFGDKLRKVQQKKIQTIQNYIDPNRNQIDEEKEEEACMIKQKFNSKSCKPTGEESQSQMRESQSQMSDQVQNKFSKGSVVSEPIVKTSLQSEFQLSNENLRLNAYQNLMQKPPQVIYQQLIEGFKNKVPMMRESSPNILKVIISLVKKASGIVNVDHLELLTYHDWKKCKYLLNEFIQTSKLSLPALEYVKNMGLVSSQPTNNRRMPVDREQNQNISLPVNSGSLNPLKTFYSSIQTLVPKMSSPDLNMRITAAETMLDLLQAVPIGAPVQSTTQPSPSLSESISQFFNVFRCRIQDNNFQISNVYIGVVKQMLQKGFLTKYRTPGRQLLSLCMQKIPNPNLTNLSGLIEEMINTMPGLLWQFLALELPKEQFCSIILDIIRKYMDEYFKTADQKTYILPLLTCISKQLQAQRSCQLLDQIVQINGQSCLQKIVKQSKLSGTYLQMYLKKWGIQSNPQKACKNVTNTNSLQQMSANSNNSNIFFANKLDRLNYDIQNPWPLSPSPSLILKLISNFVSMGEPFTNLASPMNLTQNEFSLLNSLKSEFLEDYSDLLCKWILWRMHLEFQPANVERILQLTYRIVSLGFQLQQSEIVTLLGSMLACLTIHKSSYMSSIAQINIFFNSHQLYKEKAFRFWINSFNQSNAPVEQILTLLVNSYEDMIQNELVTLARFPQVIKNKEFNDYLRAKYTEKLLSVYGFKPQNSSKFNSEKPLKSPTIQASNLSQEQRKLFLQFFQRSSSNDVIEKIMEHTDGINMDIIMETHLKIMHSIIVPYLHRELPFINVYNYFKHLQKFITNFNCVPFLLRLVQTLAYFLVDLDEMKLQNSGEMLKTINKLMLILLESSDCKHIVEVLFLLLRDQLKNKDGSKLNLLLPKCISKVIKNPSFKAQMERSPISYQVLGFIIREAVDIIGIFEISLDSPVMKTIKSILVEVLSMFPFSMQIYQSILKSGQNIHPNAEYIIREMSEQRVKQNTFTKDNEDKIYSNQKDVKGNANRMQMMNSTGNIGQTKAIQ